MSEQAPPRRTISKRGAAGVGVASLISAASGYVILVIAARALGPERNADFLVFWSVLFGVFGIVGGLQQETTRSVRSLELGHTAPDRPVRVLPVSLLVGVVAAVLLGATGFLWAPAILGPGSWPVVVALCVVAPAFAGDSALVGALAGQGSWRMYSAVVSSEAVSRLVLVGIVALAGATSYAIEVAAAAASTVWIVYAVGTTAGRRAARAAGDGTPREFLNGSGHAMLAAASSAALVVGFPVLLRLTSSDREWLVSAPLLLAISLTRAPLLMPLNAYQGVAISHFTTDQGGALRLLVRPAAALLGVGVLGAAAAFVVGPFVMVTFFGPSYHVDGLLLAALTLAAACLALLTLTGSAILAAGGHRAYAVGWLVACGVSVALLLVDLSLGARTVLSLSVGPAIGILVHLAALRRRIASRKSADRRAGRHPIGR